MTNPMRWVIAQITGKWPRRAARKVRRGPERDPEYLNWVRFWPCCVCELFSRPQATKTQACHIGPHGLSQKAPDYETVPLCDECHKSLHKLGRHEFEYLNLIDLHEVARKMKAIWEQWNEAGIERKDAWL